MPGDFSTSTLPSRPGVYVRYAQAGEPVIAAQTGSIVALPITHDWGPFKEATLIGSYSDFLAKYGRTNTLGARAVRQAFVGEDIPGKAGAGAVLVYRTGATAAAKATRTVSNTTPAVALTLTAKYQGAKGNDLRVTTQDYAADSTKTELILLDGTVEVERYLFADTDITALAVDINANSDYVTAVANITGVALGVVAASAFASGDNGDTLLASDWTAVLTALSAERFGVFAPADLTDSAIIASLKSWVQTENAAGRRFTAVIGGAAGETATTANTRSTTQNDPNIVNVGVGSIIDDRLLDANGNVVTLSTAQLAPRVAGIIAQRGESKSITFARLGGTRLVGGPTSSEIDRAFESGTVVFSRDVNPEAPVRIEKGITTYTTKTDKARPYAIFSQIKYVRTMQGIANELVEAGEFPGGLGELPVNATTRSHFVGLVQERLQARQDNAIVQPGWTVKIANDPPPSDNDDFVALSVGVRFARPTEKVFITITAT